MHAPGLLQMPALVGGDLGKHHPETHFEEAGNRGRYFDAAQVQALGAIQLYQELALDVEKRRQNGSHGLAVQGDEMLRRGHRSAHGGFRLVDDKAVDGAVFERTPASQASLPALIDGLFQRTDFPLAHHGEVRQAFFDRPVLRGGAPVEACFVEACGQVASTLLDLMKLLAIEFKFGDGHTRDYSEAAGVARENYRRFSSCAASTLEALGALATAVWAALLASAIDSRSSNWKVGASRSCTE